MPQITIDIPVRAANNLCIKFGYTGFEADGTTPQTKIDFVKKNIVIKYLKKENSEHEAGTASSTAYKAAYDDAELNVIIT